MKKFGFLAVAGALLPVAQVAFANETVRVPAAPAVQSELLPAIPSQKQSFQAVMLRGDSTLAGTVNRLDERGLSVPVSGVHISFVRNGAVISSATSNPDGRFVASTVEPGVYSVVAQSELGFYAVSVHVIAHDKTAMDKATEQGLAKISPVSFLQDGAGVLPELVLGPLVPMQDAAFFANQLGAPLPPGFDGGAPFGQGAPFGGTPMSGGGGGGSPMGGGFGDLLGLAGMGIMAAVALDNNSNNNPPIFIDTRPPVSPSF